MPRGTEGAVSLEGTLAGVGGSLVIALYAALFKLISWKRFIMSLKKSDMRMY